VNFIFEPCSLENNLDRCSFLKAIVDFKLDQLPLGKENYLMLGQTYSISLDIEVLLQV
jgi:hypothetical protein